MNEVVLVGRPTKDPELRYTNNDVAVCQFTIAVDRVTSPDGQKQADFVPIVVWGKQALSVSKYVKKGYLIAVNGRIQTRSYENSSGNKVYVTEVVSKRISFLQNKNNSESHESELQNSYTTKEIDDIHYDNDMFEDNNYELPF